MLSSVLKGATWSQLIQLCLQKVELGTYLYLANFLPTQLDQLSSSSSFFPLLIGLCHSILYLFYGPG
jgi:hypothetical protein